MKFKEIESLLNKNNGILTIKEAEENGIYRGSIKYFTEKGKLEKVSRGVYVSPGIFEDEFFVVQNRFKKGIYSLETALYLYDLTDRTPSVFNMTFPKGYNLTNPKKNGIKCKSIKEDLYELGKEEIKTPNGYNVYAYDIERTLIDIIRPINRIDIQVTSHAYKTYIKRKHKNIPILSMYAEKLGVEDKLKSYLEVLLW